MYTNTESNRAPQKTPKFLFKVALPNKLTDSIFFLIIFIHWQKPLGVPWLIFPRDSLYGPGSANLGCASFYYLWDCNGAESRQNLPKIFPLCHQFFFSTVFTMTSWFKFFPTLFYHWIWQLIGLEQEISKESQWKACQRQIQVRPQRWSIVKKCWLLLPSLVKNWVIYSPNILQVREVLHWVPCEEEITVIKSRGQKVQGCSS